MAITQAPRVRSGALPLRTYRSTGRAAAIAGLGVYAPEKVLTNRELERMVDTSDQWISERTGIKERRIAEPGTTTFELATNAAKYGALSNGHGQVAIHWQRPSRGRSNGKLVLEWRETGGPQIMAPNATGYGTSVIRDLIPYELGGAVDYQLAREGARCRLEIPGQWLTN